MKYIFRVYESHIAEYEVEADDLQAALDAHRAGESEVVEGSGEFLDVDMKAGFEGISNVQVGEDFQTAEACLDHGLTPFSEPPSRAAPRVARRWRRTSA